MKIVFVHGWGLAPDFWEPLVARFPDADITYVDLGFHDPPNLAVPDDKALYITHSLGTLWALEHCADKMSALVTINGFTCFSDFTDPRILQAMQKGLARNPEIQMQQFFKAADLKASTDNLNTTRLKEGLDWLAHKDMRHALTMPYLALLGAQDPIAPLKALQKQWQNLIICENGGHALPQTHTDWCAKHITDWLNHQESQKT